MSTPPALARLVLALALTACTAKEPEPSGQEPQPVAKVSTQKLQISTLTETLTVYGAVLPWPDKLKTISVAYTSRVEKIRVNEGQLVKEGEVLLSLEPGDDAKLQLEQAKKELDAATQEQSLLQERLHLKLATQQELVTAQLRVAQAKVMLGNLTKRGVTQKQDITAEHAGLVSVLSVQQGQIVPAGSPLLQLVDQNQWVVRLGVEPEDFEHVELNQTVDITPVNKPVAVPVKGTVATISHQIDPQTRLINVYVRPQSNQALLINDVVEAKITVSTANALVAPRSAVLPDGDAYSLFTVKEGHAVKAHGASRAGK